MHDDVRETWREWGRSLALADVEPPAWRARTPRSSGYEWRCPCCGSSRGARAAWTSVLLRCASPCSAGCGRVYALRGPAFWLARSPIR
jgi:hypothetical protein